jgi:hypothetical protein
VPAAVLDWLKMKFITLLGGAAFGAVRSGAARRCRWWFYHNASSSSRLNVAGRKIKSIVCRDLRLVIASNTTRAGR